MNQIIKRFSNVDVGAAQKDASVENRVENSNIVRIGDGLIGKANEARDGFYSVAFLL